MFSFIIFLVGENLLSDLKTSLEGNSEWIRHDVKKGKFPTLTNHKISGTNVAGKTPVYVRCETPIDPSLLSPLLSVLNESQLYEKW